MAITATYKTPHAEYPNAYIRIQRIWGSKEEGWNAWVAVFAKEGDTQQKELFSVGVPYVENENPFNALYKKVEELSFVVQKAVEPVMIPIQPATVEPVKKTKKELTKVVEEVVEEKKVASKKKVTK